MRERTEARTSFSKCMGSLGPLPSEQRWGEGLTGALTASEPSETGGLHGALMVSGPLA